MRCLKAEFELTMHHYRHFRSCSAADTNFHVHSGAYHECNRQWCIGGDTRVYGVYQPLGFFDIIRDGRRAVVIFSLRQSSASTLFGGPDFFYNTA